MNALTEWILDQCGNDRYKLQDAIDSAKKDLNASLKVLFVTSVIFLALTLGAFVLECLGIYTPEVPTSTGDILTICTGVLFMLLGGSLVGFVAFEDIQSNCKRRIDTILYSEEINKGGNNGN